MSEQQLLDKARELLGAAGLPCGDAMPDVVAPDGSNRRFWRFPGAIAVAPEDGEAVSMAEATAAWKIGRHLAAQGCAVPQIYGFDEQSGLLVMEDVGKSSLYLLVQQLKEQGDISGIRSLYLQVIEALVELQFLGKKGFLTEWCWESPVYDRELMLQKESGYFLSAWWQSLLGHDAPAGIEEEFTTLAERATQAPASFFLHRDCQSRNIFFMDNKPKFIDFQGGRLGPLGYDLASLLMDPYVGFSADMQEELLTCYLQLLRGYDSEISEERFRFWYADIALHRNLQIIGAFAFLSHQRQKTFFAQFIEPSVILLRQRLTASQFSQFAALQKMADINL